MTREEIIEAISDDKTMPFIQLDQLSEIVNFVIKNYKPSLPSDLDEAAEEYAPDFSNGFASKAAVDAIRDAFKAGAEWMARQGHTVDGTFHHSCGYPSVIELKTYLRDYEGADVIVQIRKK